MIFLIYMFLNIYGSESSSLLSGKRFLTPVGLLQGVISCTRKASGGARAQAAS